jgi:hypothetical protein
MDGSRNVFCFCRFLNGSLTSAISLLEFDFGCKRILEMKIEEGLASCGWWGDGYCSLVDKGWDYCYWLSLRRHLIYFSIDFMQCLLLFLTDIANLDNFGQVSFKIGFLLHLMCLRGIEECNQIVLIVFIFINWYNFWKFIGFFIRRRLCNKYVRGLNGFGFQESISFGLFGTCFKQDSCFKVFNIDCFF